MLLASRRLFQQNQIAKVPKVATAAAIQRQAPNRLDKWSEGQRLRSEAMSGPRFEQTDLAKQPQPLAAIDLIAQQPVIKVQGRTAVCDGGGGALGHPKVFINLDNKDANECGYCGLRFEQDHHHH